MKLRLPQPITRFIGKVMLKAKANGPDICVVTGLLCGGAAVIMVGVNTWKNKDKLSEDVKNIKQAKENGNEEEVLIPVETRKKELNRCYATLVKDIGKAYWLPAVLETGSVVLIWGGRILFRREMAALGAAYAMLMDSFQKYRNRVVEDQGAEADSKYMFGDNLIVTNEDGEGNTKIAVAHDPNKNISRYARWFDAGEYDSENDIWLWRNPAWRPDCARNEATLRFKQQVVNDNLKAYGYVFLNDVYKELGLPPTKEGQIVGWTIDGGDRYIDFGIWPSRDRPKSLAVNEPFMRGESPNVMLDFNVDGPILYRLESIYGIECTEKLIRMNRG